MEVSLRLYLNEFPTTTDTGLFINWSIYSFNFWALTKYFGLLITLFSALRLAKFNIDKEQTYYFKGLNTPANTIFILSLFYIQKNYHFELLNNFWFLSAITLAFSYLLVTDIPLFSLKFKNFKWKDNSLTFSFLFICILLFIFLHVLAIPILIILYIILSIIFRKKIVANGTKTT
jgi:CDP-diacylglycerol--serine O-phosphatidyltransferase